MGDQTQMVFSGMNRRRPPRLDGDERKRRGMERALKNEREVMRQRALRVLMGVAEKRLEFTADQLHEAWDAAGVTFHHQNVVGGLIKTAVDAGVMTRTGEYRKSRRPSRHGSIIAVYRAVRDEEAA